MKKILFSLFALFITTMVFAYDAEIDGIYYNLDIETKTAEVTEWHSDNYSDITSVTIPEKVTYNGVEYSITSIGVFAFYECSSLTSITIPNSVTEIGIGAFYGCSSLSSIVIPNSVISIGSEAFYGCSSLSSITIPNSVISIGSEAFFDCLSLVSVHISDISAWCNIEFEYRSNPLYCAKNLYLNNKKVTDLVIPEGVDSIKDYVFHNCLSLTSIKIPNSVTSIGNLAFYGCTSLMSIDIDENNKDYTSIDGVLYDKKKTTLIRCLQSKISVEIPNSVIKIENDAFFSCLSLTSIVIPNSVISIGESAFWGCSSLSSITIPNSVTEIEDRTFAVCSSLASVTIGNSVTSIGLSAFEGCTSLSSIAIPNSVTSIEGYVFRGCTGLTSIEIPNSVTSIGMSAFEGCTSLSSIAIPNSVTSIERYVFSGCTGLTSVAIGSSVTSFEENAFENCSSLSTIKWNVKKYNDFDNKYKKNPFVTNPITSFVFGDSVEYIPAYLCYDLNDLNSVIISNSVTEIGERAFYYCGKLRTVEIGNSIEIIGDDAFRGCTAIYSISIGAIIPPIVESSTFESVSRTAQIKVPCNAVAAYQASTYWNEFTNYVETPYTLVVNTNDNTMGNAIVIKQPTCQDISAQVQAQALPGYEFVKWSDGFTENPHTVFVTSDTTITAEFRVASTPVENTYDSNVKIYANGGNLNIEGITEDYQVFDAFGRLVYVGRESALSLPCGVYVVVIGNEVQKVVL